MCPQLRRIPRLAHIWARPVSGEDIRFTVYVFYPRAQRAQDHLRFLASKASILSQVQRSPRIYGFSSLDTKLEHTAACTVSEADAPGLCVPRADVATTPVPLPRLKASRRDVRPACDVRNY